MDLSFLEDLGKQLLQEPKFAKILGDIGGKEFSKVLSGLTGDLKKAKELAESKPKGLGEEAKGASKKAINEAKKTVKAKIEEIKQKIKILKQKNIPRFETYTVSGRIYDSQTAKPLRGVKIKAGIDSAQIPGSNVEVKTDISTPPALSSLNTDIKLATDFRLYAPIKELMVTKNPTTDRKGYYSVKVKVLVVGVEDESNTSEKRELTSILDLGLSFTKSGYIPASTAIINLDKSIKRDIRTKGMFNIDVAAQKAKDEINNTIYAAGQRLSSIGLEVVEKILIARKKSVQNVINLLTQKLIPVIISILLYFAITKPSQMNDAVCPSPEKLKEAIERRNKIIRQINQVYTAIIVNTGLAALFIIISQAILSVRGSLDSLVFPMSIGTPPAKDFGGLASSITYNVVAALQRIDDLLEDIEKQNKKLNKQLLISIGFLIAGLIICRILLKAIDEGISKCAQEKIDSGEITLVELREEIRNLDSENEEQGLNVGKVNGFEITVIEGKNVVGSITPRQAIAKNSDGVIQLRGEQSFSATDQVLINELAFYIKSNNLKAF
tara:strand:+ start:276 stop:1934 length:1659 start_codon:yes stop_codon:yes gene_type:complete